MAWNTLPFYCIYNLHPRILKELKKIVPSLKIYNLLIWEKMIYWFEEKLRKNKNVGEEPNS